MFKKFRNIYRWLYKKYERKELRIYLFKTKWSNRFSILKKRKHYKHIKYTKEQKELINNIWKQTKVGKISHKWHKYYQSINGKFNKYYIPSHIYLNLLEPSVNNRRKTEFFEDKSVTEILYGSIDKVSFPRTFVVNISGVYYDGNRQIITFDAAINILNNLKDFVIKQTIGTSQGENVLIFENTTLDSIEIKKLLLDYKENFIVQEKIKQHKTFSTLHPQSVNPVRITTYTFKDKVEIMPLRLKCGAKGNNLDASHLGGIVIGVHNDGSLYDYGFQMTKVEKNKRIYNHPDSGVIFTKHKLDFIPKMIEVAKTLHERTPYVKMISWDMVVDENNNIVLIEGNYMGAGVDLTQIATGEGLFGEDLVSVINEYLT